jgi:hypothetical protein
MKWLFVESRHDAILVQIISQMQNTLVINQMAESNVSKRKQFLEV